MVGPPSEATVRGQFLRNFQVSSVSPEWLTACIEWLREDDSSLSEAEFCNEVLQQWLSTDFDTIEFPYLPDAISNTDTLLSELPPAAIPLQVNEWLDISQSCYSQLEKLTGKDLSNNTVGIPPWDQTNRVPAKRMLMLTLTDGVQTVKAMEVDHQPLLCPARMRPGMKILVRGNIQCRRGILLLRCGSILKVLGGEVEDKLKSHHPNNVLARRIGRPIPQFPAHEAGSADVGDSGYETTTTGGNVSTGRSEGSQSSSSSITGVTRSGISVGARSQRSNAQITSFQTKPVVSASVKPPASEFPSHNRLQEACAAPPLIADEELDIDPEELFRMEEECLKLEAESHAEDSLERTSPVVSRSVSGHSAPTKRPKICNTSEHPSASHTAATVAVVAPIPNSGNSHGSKKLPLSNEIASLDSQIPFTPLTEIARDTKIPVHKFQVRGFIQTLAGKLASHGNQWSLPIKIEDGSACCFATVSNEYLTELIGFSCEDSRAVRTSGSEEEQLKLRSGLGNCQQALISLNGVLIVEKRKDGLYLISSRNVTLNDVGAMKRAVRS